MANIEIVSPKKDWRVVLHEVLRVGDNLDDEFRRHAYLLGRAVFFSAQASRRVLRLKNELKALSARLRKNITAIEGKLTRDEMEYAVERKKIYRNKQRELEEAIYEEDVISGLVKALDHKKDCLVQISANSRKELPEELRALTKSLRERMRS